ncbi:MAG TPA: GTPase HflX [Aquificales bacterium]|nr:GTPase HflX [Aquificales bacterium]HIO42079.1 GTPase HflX [Aquifex sp.]
MRAILVGVWKKGETKGEVYQSINELGGLVEAVGGKVLGKLVQKRDIPDPSTYIGKGRVEDLNLLVQGTKADAVVFDDPLTPSQVKELEKRLRAKVLDRTDLVLEIFTRRARTKEAKLQVELAKLQHELPRLYGKGKALSRQAGGIGGRGPGEQEAEIRRRILKKRIHKIKQELEEVKKRRREQRKRRIKEVSKEGDFVRVAIVGYTNVGKSTLMKALTGRDVFKKDMLFATLDTTTSSRYVYPDLKVLFTDTVGFINKLPTELIEAFKATLEEIEEADIILHVVDASDPKWLEKIETVNGILKKLNLEGVKQILVFNKVDRLVSSPEEVEYLDHSMLVSDIPNIYVSAEKKWNINGLLNMIYRTVKGENAFQSFPS